MTATRISLFLGMIGVIGVIVAGTGCTEDATQIVVAIGTDYTVPAELGFVRVARCPPGSRPPDVVGACRFSDFDLAAGQTVPFSMTMGARDGALDEAIAVIVIGYRASPGDTPIAARVVETQFRANQTLGLPVFLFRDCPAMCGADTPQICCGSIDAVVVRPGAELDLLDGGMRPPPLDGGGRCERDDDCDDDDPCTMDHCGSEGRCDAPSAVTCPDDDGNECTVEMCDSAEGGCVAANADDDEPCDGGDGACCGGVCADTQNDAMSCGACGVACGANERCSSGSCACEEDFESCSGACVDTQVNASHCGRCGAACEDPTPACMGGRCGACTSDDDCAADDGLDCTNGAPTCTAGACVYAIDEDACVIDGVCVAEDDRDPENDCHACVPSESQADWTNRAVGEDCDDGLFCTSGSACRSGGSCGGGSATDCADTLSCTTDRCDETMDACTHTPVSGRCVIDDACVNAGARNPANQCESCVPTTSQTGWTVSMTGTTCDDGVVCTVGDACNALGVCTGSLNACDDGLTCTDDSCDMGDDACVNTPRDTTADGTPDFCVVGGVCYASGAMMGTNTCATCQPAVSTTELSAVTNETGCMIGPMPPNPPGHCCNGTCQPLNSAAHCMTCGNACTAGQNCGVFSMEPPLFMCCTSCPMP